MQALIEAKDIKNVTVAGAGTMGAQIALQCARSGLNVVVYDIEPKQLQAAPFLMQYLWDSISKHSMNDKQPKQISKKGEEGISKNSHLEFDEIKSRIRMTKDLAEAAKDCDLLSESIPENPTLKGQFFAEFNKLCPAHTIFTTNTSTLLPSMFAAESGRPERLLALHFHMPLLTPALVDVMPHQNTDPQTTKVVAEFAEIIGQVALIPNKENNGYIFNHMLTAVLDAALDLVINDIASIEQVDRSWMGIMQMPQGPFAMMDHIGLGTVYAISNYWAEVENSDARRKRVAFIKTYLDQGHAGIKTGKGFYSYPQPAYQKAGFVEGAQIIENYRPL